MPKAARAGGAARKGTAQGLKSIMMAEFTPRHSSIGARWIGRKSITTERLARAHRLWYSTLVNIVEAYHLLKMFGCDNR